MSHSKSVNHILHAPNSGVATIVQRATLLNRLNAELQTLLDKPLSDHIYVANVRANTLVIGTHSAIWHSRVKYLGSAILQHMNSLKGWEFLQHIEFRVQPHMAQQLTPAGGNGKSAEPHGTEKRLSQNPKNTFSSKIKGALTKPS